MNIYEQGEGFFAFGHHDPLEFREACYREFNKRPAHIKLVYYKNVYKKSEKRYTTTIEKCDKDDHGSFEVTTGSI